jgi:hypothetical protein
MSDATSFLQEKYNSIISFMKENWAPIMFIVFCILMYFIMQKPNKRKRRKNKKNKKTYARNVYRNGVRIKRSIFTIPTFKRRADGKKIRRMSLKELMRKRDKVERNILNQKKKWKALRKKYEHEVADKVEMYINNKKEELKYILERIKAKESIMKRVRGKEGNIMKGVRGKKSKKKSKKKRKKRKRQNLKNPFNEN